MTSNRLLGPTAVTSLDEYVANHGGGRGLVAARHRNATSLIDLITRSGLRGRGGAGYPTGRKWATVACSRDGTSTVIVNAAEGEPGTFKDRALLRSNPYQTLEGACIAALAVGAADIVVGIKAAFTTEIDRLRDAIDEVSAAGWLDRRSIRLVAASLVGGRDDVALKRLTTVSRGARCALAGQTESLVGRLLELAGGSDVGPNGVAWPVVPMVDIVDGHAVLDRSHLDKRPDWSYPGEEASDLDPVDLYADHPVVIRAPHVRERANVEPSAGSPPARDDHSVFEEVERRHAAIESTMLALRTAQLDQRPALLSRLRRQLRQHTDGIERFIFPALERINPESGQDIAWYPQHHMHHAQHLLDRLSAFDASIDGEAIDDLCNDVHVAIVETDRRVLPLLVQLMDDSEVRELAADVGANKH